MPKEGKIERRGKEEREEVGEGSEGEGKGGSDLTSGWTLRDQ